MDRIINVNDLYNIHFYMPQWLKEYIFYFFQMGYKYAIDHMKLVLFLIGNVFILYVFLGAMTYTYLVKYSLPCQSNQEEVKKRVLVVIAHPDDECMFFGPTILRLVSSSEVYMLCLSIGNHYKQGNERKKELYNSCKAFGITESNVMVMNNSRTPDNPGVIWNSEEIARILLDHIESLSVSEVYTFDIGGVSGHLNHISIFLGFAHLCLSGKLPFGVRVFLLDSVNKLRKYSFFFDAALSFLLISKRLFVVSLVHSGTIRRAMHEHQSQMVWYRAIYIYLSRYMYINTYKELILEDVQLTLQMSDYSPKL